MKKLLLYLLLGTSLAISAQDTAAVTGEIPLINEDKTAFSLEEAIDFATNRNIDAINADLNIMEAKARVGELVGTGLPKIDFNLNYQLWAVKPKTIFPGSFSPQSGAVVDANGMPLTDANGNLFGATLITPEGGIVPGDDQEVAFVQRHNITPGFELSQLLFSGSYLYGLEAAKMYVELSKKQKEAGVNDIADRVIKAYYNCLIAEENLIILDKNIGNLTKIKSDLEQLYINGFIEQLDVDRVTLSLSNLNIQKENVVRMAQVGKELLKFQMGYDLRNEIELTNKLSDFIDEEVTLVNPEDLHKQRKDFEVLGIQEELNQIDEKRLQSQRYPTVALFGSHQWQFQSDDFRLFGNKWFPATTVGLAVNVPLFDGFQTKYQVAQRQVNTERIKLGKEYLKQAYLLEYRNAQTALINAQESVKSQQKNLDLAQKIYDISLIKYNEGIGSSVELNQAESSLFQTQQLYIQALYNLVIAKADLNKAMGKF